MCILWCIIDRINFFCFGHFTRLFQCNMCNVLSWIKYLKSLIYAESKIYHNFYVMTTPGCIRVNRPSKDRHPCPLRGGWQPLPATLWNVQTWPGRYTSGPGSCQVGGMWTLILVYRTIQDYNCHVLDIKIKYFQCKYLLLNVLQHRMCFMVEFFQVSVICIILNICHFSH